MLTDAQRGALHIIRAAGGMVYQPDDTGGAYFAGDVQIPASVAQALIRHHYVAVDATRKGNRAAVFYCLTGEDIEESEGA